MSLRRWSHSINIKQFLKEGEQVSSIVTNVKRELDRLPESLRLSDTWAWDEIIEGFDEAAEEENVELFDDALSNLYDWADENRVWLGVRGAS